MPEVKKNAIKEQIDSLREKADALELRVAADHTDSCTHTDGVIHTNGSRLEDFVLTRVPFENLR